MAYREPPPDRDEEEPRDGRAARLAAEWAHARARTRLLLEAAGLTSVFGLLEPFHQVPRFLIHIGCTVWTTLLLVSLASWLETRWIARDLGRAQDD